MSRRRVDFAEEEDDDVFTAGKLADRSDDSSSAASCGEKENYRKQLSEDQDLVKPILDNCEEQNHKVENKLRAASNEDGKIGSDEVKRRGLNVDSQEEQTGKLFGKVSQTPPRLPEPRKLYFFHDERQAQEYDEEVEIEPVKKTAGLYSQWEEDEDEEAVTSSITMDVRDGRSKVSEGGKRRYLYEPEQLAEGSLWMHDKFGLDDEGMAVKRDVASAGRGVDNATRRRRGGYRHRASQARGSHRFSRGLNNHNGAEQVGASRGGTLSRGGRARGSRRGASVSPGAQTV